MTHVTNIYTRTLFRFLLFAFFIPHAVSCQDITSTDKFIFEKNKCYDLKLEALKKDKLYNNVLSAFNDTFPKLKTEKEYFGVPEIVSNQIDDAIFFKKDSNECILIVLQKSKPPEYVFGTARIIRGFLKRNEWQFEVSMEFYFEKDYFKLFKENSFENISKLARYSVLTKSNPVKEGCEINNKFWFIDLNK